MFLLYPFSLSIHTVCTCSPHLISLYLLWSIFPRLLTVLYDTVSPAAPLCCCDVRLSAFSMLYRTIALCQQPPDKLTTLASLYAHSIFLHSFYCISLFMIILCFHRSLAFPLLLSITYLSLFKILLYFPLSNISPKFYL